MGWVGMGQKGLEVVAVSCFRLLWPGMGWMGLDWFRLFNDYYFQQNDHEL